MHHRNQLCHGILAGVLLLAHPSFTGRTCAEDATAANTGNLPKCYLLENRPNDLVILRFDSETARKQLSAPDNFSVSRGDGSVTVSGPMKGSSQHFTVNSGAKPWDLANYLYLATDVHNDSTQAVTVVCRAQDPEYAGWHHYAESVARIGAGESTTVLVLLKRKYAPADTLRTLFPGMDTLPDGYMPHWSGLDPARITTVVFGLEAAEGEIKLEVSRLRAVGVCDATPLTAPDYFPFIDSFGQFQHADWPTKIHSPADFAAQRSAEATAIQAHPRPASWDQYGGYQEGPQLAATGNFRVEKYGGKWWLVDPDGRLFWSHGVTCVGFSSSTPVWGRQHFFADIPAGSQNGHGQVNWYLANLREKFGPNATAAATALVHQRLASWGLNTMACWSDLAVTGQDKTPYTQMVNIGGPRLAPGLKLSDPYAASFATSARQAFAAEKHTTGTDPWCIGYFIGNELEWRGGPELINEVLTAGATQPGKQALVKLLQQRHANIAELNRAWHTTYADWNQLLEQTNKVDAALAGPDFIAFNEQLAQRYYQTIENELKRTIPGKLNLGTRFNTVNPITVRASARYCDVVSFNKYETSIRNLSLPDGIDRPIIIGEFHFPAWDRSYAASAGCGRLGEVQRADCYWHYVNGALENPLIVGTHWFQYLDQPLTGRSDGENFPVGFVDVTDTPYEELVQTTRELGANLYAHRLSAGSRTTLSLSHLPGR